MQADLGGRQPWPYIARSDPIAFTAVGMVAGAATLATLAAVRGSLSAALALDAAQGLAVGYLGLVGGALTFFLWSAALGRATPTQVALSVTVNPISASLVGLFLLGEPAGWPLAAGIAAVFGDLDRIRERRARHGRGGQPKSE